MDTQISEQHPTRGLTIKQPANILIVDDLEPNRAILHDLILSIGHHPILATGGVEALQQLAVQLPDLVLLDILMPGMDGYEVLACLKADYALRHLPVIVISAIGEMDSIVRCIQLGADDYLTKPFNITLLKARIQACLEKKYLLDQEDLHRQQIAEYGLRLEGMVCQKTQELAAAYERLKILDTAKSDFLRIISHELRTPLNGLVGTADMLFQRNLDKETEQELQLIFESSLARFVEIVKQAQLLTQIEVSQTQFTTQQSQVASVISLALKASAAFAEARHVQIQEPVLCDAPVYGEETLLHAALSALLQTAIRFAKEQSTLAITTELTDTQVLIDIEARGWTIPERFLGDFFGLFSITDSIIPGGDLGLAPPLAERILRLSQGSVSVSNLQPAGVHFQVCLARVLE
jgi:two-component system, sensor histidine kinase and response regulator